MSCVGVRWELVIIRTKWFQQSCCCRVHADDVACKRWQLFKQTKRGWHIFWDIRLVCIQLRWSLQQSLETIRYTTKIRSNARKVQRGASICGALLSCSNSTAQCRAWLPVLPQRTEHFWIHLDYRWYNYIEIQIAQEVRITFLKLCHPCTG